MPTRGRRSWLRSKPISDEEFVEQIRRQVEIHRRWRRWLVGLYGVVGVAFAGLSGLFANRVADLVQRFGVQWIALGGFGMGLLLGMAVGMLGHSIASGFVAMLSEPRTERLLLRYRDALEELTGVDPESAEESRRDALV